jgi:hypothetical protein
MASKRHKASSKQAQRMREVQMRALRLHNLKRAHKLLIPDDVLKALAAMHLPNDARAYTEKLQELLT